MASWVSRGARVARACSSRGIAMPRAMATAWSAIDDRRVFSSVGSSAPGDDEKPWRRRAEHHEATPRAPTWSTTALGANATGTKEPIDRVELENVARLANVRIDDVDATLEDVNGILRFVEALDGRTSRAWRRCGARTTPRMDYVCGSMPRRGGQRRAGRRANASSRRCLENACCARPSTRAMEMSFSSRRIAGWLGTTSRARTRALYDTSR